MKDLQIRPLGLEDAETLSALMTSGDVGYSGYFLPFETSADSLARRLAEARKDRYWGVWFDRNLAAFFMLRGFDEGYHRPSFGVYIGQTYADRGLSRLAINYAISWCQLNGVAALMLKVHPDNRFARRSYEKAGFKDIGICPNTGHLVMELRWAE
jgi:RimJ/RimL family protein N-acetyltransferase